MYALTIIFTIPENVKTTNRTFTCGRSGSKIVLYQLEKISKSWLKHKNVLQLSRNFILSSTMYFVRMNIHHNNFGSWNPVKPNIKYNSFHFFFLSCLFFVQENLF